MINTDAGLPPLEGDIEGVSIPFFGVRAADAARLTAATQVSVAFHQIDNPGYRRVVGFSSSGPRFGDSALQPSVIAPGVSVVSVGVGTGAGPATISGTSQAAPAVTGLAALARQAHPRWSASQIAAAISSTADPALIDDYQATRAGTGVPQAGAATKTRATLTSDGASAVNFGYIELASAYAAERRVSVQNHADSPASFSIALPPSLQAAAVGMDAR